MAANLVPSPSSYHLNSGSPFFPRYARVPYPRNETTLSRAWTSIRIRAEETKFFNTFSLTCRLLHDLALPIRFKHVELHAQGTEGTKPTEVYSRLSKSGNLRNFVKVVSVWVYGAGFPLLPDSAQDILCGMHNLEDIRLMSPFQMTTSLYSHIYSLHSLHRLKVATLQEHTPNIIELTPITSHQLSVKSLSVVCDVTSEGYEKPRAPCWAPQHPRVIILPPWIASVTHSPSVHHLRLPIHIPFTVPIPRTFATPLPHLITLEVTAPRTIPEWEEFLQFTSLAPLIATLILRSGVPIFDPPTPDPTIPSKLFPALRCFEGILRYANLVVPGRPVDTVMLTPLLLRESSVHLHPLRLSTAIVRSVDIRFPRSLGCIATIGELFPYLQEFRMRVSTEPNSLNVQEWLQKHFASDIGKLHYLRTLEFNSYNEIPFDDEKGALSRLPEDHPLERARFSTCSHRWSCGCSDGLWQKLLGVWVRF